MGGCRPTGTNGCALRTYLDTVSLFDSVRYLAVRPVSVSAPPSLSLPQIARAKNASGKIRRQTAPSVYRILASMEASWKPNKEPRSDGVCGAWRIGQLCRGTSDGFPSRVVCGTRLSSSSGPSRGIGEREGGCGVWIDGSIDGRCTPLAVSGKGPGRDSPRVGIGPNWGVAVGSAKI
jgi:hypothetical protein